MTNSQIIKELKKLWYEYHASETHHGTVYQRIKILEQQLLRNIEASAKTIV